ncbi:hypothetical protein CI238_11843 [Colletotrichum incanum]|uniref:Uncharacterized protein n=1 Tax=Colletotrichum incanum TaxID=1573173 RepID=A0A166N1U2_COLIC|nr:hypothetical protein CI238_11843 [Colletotrichum incanum]
MSIDVAEFHEGDKHWAQDGEFLRLVLEDESSGSGQGGAGDRVEGKVDAYGMRQVAIRVQRECSYGQPSLS